MEPGARGDGLACVWCGRSFGGWSCADGDSLSFHDLHVGDPVDFWRVERVQSGKRLLLAAEMKMPGRLWLQFDVEATGRGTEIRQTTVFDPAGYVGLAYWYLLYPVHHVIFKAMLRGVQRVSQSTATVRVTPPTANDHATEARVAANDRDDRAGPPAAARSAV